MYIEMIDETGQVSEKLKEQTLELLDFAAEKLGKEDKEMAVTFVTNERSHELNLEYRDTDRPTDVISLEYKPLHPRRRSGNVWITGRNFDCLWTYATIIHKKSGKIENLQLVLSLL